MKALKLNLLAVAAAALLAASSAFGGTIVAGFDSDGSLAGNDDLSTGELSLGFTINFFGINYSGLYANNNGNVTFNAAMGTFTPFDLASQGTPIIAPFFADVYTDNPASDVLRYGAGTFAGRNAFGVTWAGAGVGYYFDHAEKLNKFQVLLVDRSDVVAGDFDIYFNYDQIQWEAGDASGGTNGLGGDSARAGYSNGTPENSYEIAGSAINGAFLDSNLATGLVNNSNIGLNGRYLFEVRNGVIEPPPATVPDSASTFALLGAALAGLIVFRRRG